MTQDSDALDALTGSVEGACADGNCDDALEQLELYLDGELPSDRLGVIREHLAACYPCADRATFEEQLRALVRDRCAEATPPGLKQAILQRLDSMGATQA